MRQCCCTLRWLDRESLIRIGVWGDGVWGVGCGEMGCRVWGVGCRVWGVFSVN
ncbi:hypothetical protein RVR34_09345 [Microcystis aeruginosa FBCC-A68]|uniref:hypothetical protein n=1 Tax=Microcystis aeruginosa TaxID=1126 RepID=UPI001482991E|nr:hypothetical protein [Microcystis aeruginosa]